MKTIFIHIGTEKTGTSSIQDFLTMNRASLNEEGILYPKSILHLNNHLYLAILCAPHHIRTLEMRQGLNLLDVKDLEYQILYRKQKFIKEIRNSNAKSIILSSEHLSSRLDNVDQIVRLSDLIYEACDAVHSIKVIVYLRRQDQLLASYYSTAIKTGSSKEFRPENILDPWFNYQSLLDPWEQIFGKDSIIVRIYNQGQLFDSNIITDFMNVIGYPSTLKWDVTHLSNPSLSSSRLAILRLFNEYTRFFIETEGVPGAFRKNIVGYLENMPDFHFQCQRIAVGSRTQRRLLNMFKDSNDYVAQHYLGVDKLFSEELNSFELDRIPTVSVEEAIFTMVYLFYKKFHNE